MRRVLKWPVPVDDKAHMIGPGKVVLVEAQHRYPETVYVWTEERGEEAVEPVRPAMVYGDGQPISPDSIHLGSVQCVTDVPGLPLVWHVYGMPLWWKGDGQ